MSDLDQRVLDDALGSWAPEVRFLEECGSTNALALEWARQGAPEGCLVVADQQSSGRGRRGRSWFSLPGRCLMFSLILRPAGPAPLLGLLNLAAGVALCRSLDAQGVKAGLKWPNDLLLGGRKAAGMLAESETEGGSILAVVGVGLNVSLGPADFPEGVEASSLLIHTGREMSRLDLLVGFLVNFELLYQALQVGRPAGLIEDYLALCETLGKRVRVETPSGGLEGVAVGVDQSGALLLDGGREVSVGDVIHLK